MNPLNAAPNIANHSDPISGFAAIPRNMTGIATKLSAAGYRTHSFGKWDAGMATPGAEPAHFCSVVAVLWLLRGFFVAFCVAFLWHFVTPLAFLCRSYTARPWLPHSHELFPPCKFTSNLQLLVMFAVSSF